MKKQKEIVFLIKVMSGGGAERVVSLLSKAVVEKGYQTTLLLTHQSKKDALLTDLNPQIKVVSLQDEISDIKTPRFRQKTIMLLARFIGKLKFLNKKAEYKASVLKYLSRNLKEVLYLKNFFKARKGATAVAFLYDSIFLSLLAKGKRNRLIISERGDPRQSANSKTTMAFLKNEFQKADGFVFQSPDAQQWYLENTTARGTVIFNPVKADLPEPYKGVRRKKIVNFCRVSAQKNLLMLVDAFEMFNKHFPEYELFIYGDPVGNDAEDYIESVEEKIDRASCKDKIFLLPSRRDIHDEIKDYSMFVSSSDFEGMSNSMLEAMALGLPCVCTDCPAGGARAVINDGENGLLVPVGDSEKLYLAMKRVVEDEQLSNKLSQNSVLVRETQSLEKIIEKWLEIIYN